MAHAITPLRRAANALNPRHLKFANLILKGVAPKDAHKQAGFPLVGKSNTRTLAASKLTGGVKMKRYLVAAKEAAVQEGLLSLTEIRQYNADIVRAKPSDLSPDSPLCEEITVNERFDKEGNVIGTRTTMKMPGKYQAIAMEVKIMGWGAAETVNVKHSGSVGAAVLLCPMEGAKLDDWEKAAEASQAKLMETMGRVVDMEAEVVE